MAQTHLNSDRAFEALPAYNLALKFGKICVFGVHILVFCLLGTMNPILSSAQSSSSDPIPETVETVMDDPFSEPTPAKSEQPKLQPLEPAQASPSTNALEIPVINEDPNSQAHSAQPETTPSPVEQNSEPNQNIQSETPLISEPETSSDTSAPVIESVSAPEEMNSANADSLDQEEEEELDEDTPLYFKQRPHFALSFRGAWPGVPSSNAIGVSIQVLPEYLISLSKVGTLALGMHLGHQSFLERSAYIRYGDPSSFALGVQARYLLRWTQAQWLIPIAGLEYTRSWMAYAVPTGAVNADGSLQYAPKQSYVGADFGWSLGGLINLSVLDGETARDAYLSSGIVASYLSIEIRKVNYSASNVTLNLSGYMWYAGFRLEFK